MVCSVRVHPEVEGRWVLNLSQFGGTAVAQVFEGPRAEFNAALALYDHLLLNGATVEQVDACEDWIASTQDQPKLSVVPSEI